MGVKADSTLAQLVEVDPIRFQAAQAGFNGRKDIATGRSFERFGLVHRQAELRGEDDIFTALPKKLA